MRAYVLTLFDYQDRFWNAGILKSSLSARGFEVILAPAVHVTAREFRNIPWAAAADLPQPMTAGELACTYGHVEILRKIVKSDLPAFVLEDDAEMLIDLSTLEIPPYIDYIHMSAFNREDAFNKQIEVVAEGDPFMRVKGLPYGSQCYYITPRAAAKTLEQFVPIRWVTDLAFNDLSRRDVFPTYMSTRPAATQRGAIASQIGPR